MASRTARNGGIALAVVGLVFLVVAALLYWVIVPSQARVPGDTNITRQYSGTAKIAIDTAALAAGNTAAAVIINSPVTVTRTVRVEATSGDAAEINDSRTVKTTSGQEIGRSSTTYAVNRHTLQNEPDHPSSWKVTSHQGLTVSFPIPTNKHDYTGWVTETQRTTPLKFSGQETRSGLKTYVFKSDVGPQPITDPGTLASLPPALPVSALTALSAVLPISDADKARLAQALPSLTQPVPLLYTYQVKSTYWVEPTTGSVIDNQREEIRKVGLRLPNGQTLAAVIPVSDVSAKFTSQSIKQAADEATNHKNKIDLWGRIVPLILLIVGAIALIAGIVLTVLAARRSRPSPYGGTEP